MGFGAFANWFLLLVGSVGSWFLKHVAWRLGQRLSIAGVALVTFAGLVAVFHVAISALLNGLVATLPDVPGVEMAFYVACPDVLPTCFSALISAKIAASVYSLNVQRLMLLQGSGSV